MVDIERISGVSKALHAAVSGVCPIHGISIGDVDDKSTWSIRFMDEASSAQRDAANAVLETFVYGPDAGDVRTEAQRRIIALAGASDLNSCIIKQLNASMRATELNDIRASGGTLTPEQEAEEDILRGLAAAIKAIRAASNVLEPSPPADYTDDKYWP